MVAKGGRPAQSMCPRRAPSAGSMIPLGLVFMVLFLSAERFGHFEQPMSNSVFDLPMYRFCGTITGDLLGRDHPLARPRESDDALVWW